MVRKSQKTCRGHERGFSLVELLVAITIAGLLISGIMTVLSTSIRTLQVLEKHLDMTQQARVALERMTRELASAFHPYGMFATTSRTPMPWLEIRAAGGGATGGQEISFIANMYQKDELEAGTGADVGDLMEVHYSVRPDGTETNLYRRKDKGTLGDVSTRCSACQTKDFSVDRWSSDPDGTDPEGPAIMASYVNNLSFRVWDRNGADAGTPYNYDQTISGFPSRIRISMTMYDPDGIAPDYTFISDISTLRNVNNLE